MADLSSTKKDATWEEWQEQLITMLEINGYNPSFCDTGRDEQAGQAYDEGQAVDDYFYDNYDADE